MGLQRPLLKVRGVVITEVVFDRAAGRLETALELVDRESSFVRRFCAPSL